MSKGRMEAFSDGVIAIIISLRLFLTSSLIIYGNGPKKFRSAGWDF